jgi:hypothetical protein
MQIPRACGARDDKALGFSNLGMPFGKEKRKLIVLR